jgi:Zn-dependent protease with chaperone function
MGKMFWTMILLLVFVLGNSVFQLIVGISFWGFIVIEISCLALLIVSFGNLFLILRKREPAGDMTVD